MSEPVTAVQAGRDGWRHLLVMLAMIAVGFLAQPGPAAAQVQTYIYQGPAFDVALCQSTYPTPPPACPGGSIVGSVTFLMSAGYTGTLSKSDIASFDFAASGIGSVGASGIYNPLASQSFTFTNGQLNSWTFDVLTGVSTSPPYTEITSQTGQDGAFTTDSSGNLTAVGRNITYPVVGQWLNPKSLGIACNQAGGCATGEPINLGTGNVFDQITDYETTGPNQLSLIRYYNSMATPDTSAVSMGQNWRTNYDRYLHVINPAAIYGVLAERPDGRVISFTSNSGTYTTDSDVDLKLANTSGSTWTLTDPNDTVETYTVTAGLGKLTNITQRNKYTQALTYSGSAIAFVSDSYTRKLTFGYSAGLLTTVSTPEFTSGLTYGYVAFASAGTHALQTVTYKPRVRKGPSL